MFLRKYRLETPPKSACIFALLGSAAFALAEPASDESVKPVSSALSVDEIALELSSPAPRLGGIAVDMEYTTFQGSLPEADDQTAFRSVITGSWPIRLSSGNDLLLRATLPILGDQPYWQPANRRDYADFVIRQVPSIDPTTGQFITGHDHLGDISVDVGYGGVNENGLTHMFGIVITAPTSEDRSARRAQWLVGPEIALGRTTRWGLYGVRAQHLTDISGEGKQEVDLDTNETTLRLSFAYALGNGWQIESNPVISYDWEAVSDNKWTVPVGAGVSKTVLLGSVPMKMAVELHNYVVSPDRFGPEWLLRFAVTPVFSSKLLR